MSACPGPSPKPDIHTGEVQLDHQTKTLKVSLVEAEAGIGLDQVIPSTLGQELLGLTINRRYKIFHDPEAQSEHRIEHDVRRALATGPRL